MRTAMESTSLLRREQVTSRWDRTLVLSHDLLLSALALPDGHGDSPVPLTGDAPFLGSLDPVLLPGGTGPVGDPFGPVDLLEHLVLDLGDVDEPLPGVPVDDG